MKFHTGMLKEGAEDNLVMLASGGNSLAKNILMSRYQPFVVRLVKRMNVRDAEDVAQDVLLKVMVSLHRFEHRSQFTTWLYRITINHVLSLKRNSKQIAISESVSWDADSSNTVDIDEEKLHRYMMGVVICLQPEQRSTLIFADHFGSDQNSAAASLGITRVNFRKRLSRARRDLKQWTNNHCSLMIAGGSCSCSKKKKIFIEQGWVDRTTEKFTQEWLTKVAHTIQTRYLSGDQASTT